MHYSEQSPISLLLHAWRGIFFDVPLCKKLEGESNQHFPGFWVESEYVGLAQSGKYWVAGWISEKKDFTPSAGPFDTPHEAISALIGMVANNRAARLLGEVK